jgi:pimeloyl-ACP methyl ester carboxylesterase
MAADPVATIPVVGAEIAYRRIGNGRPLLVLNGFAATSADWDPPFVDRLASFNELILVDNRGIGASTDNGKPFGIAQLADWGGPDAELAPASVWSQLVETSGTPHEQARRLLSLLFPSDVAESIYGEFGDLVAAARARLSAELVSRQATAMERWHHDGVGNRLREIRAPTLIATGGADIVIPPSNALRLVNAIRGAWLAQFNGGGHAFIAQYPRELADLINGFLAIG